MAGILAADGGGGDGIRGISDAHLINGRVLQRGSGKFLFSIWDIAEAIQWATDAGADVINMSLSSPSFAPHEPIRDAIEYATNHDALVVAAAGNEGEDEVGYPARYDEAVAVAATDRNDDFVDRWPGSDGGSNYGSNVDLCAPGVEVLSSVPGGYDRLSGTSMATPVVAGVAALALAVDPELSTAELRRVLRETATDVGERAAKQGAGRVDALNVVEAVGGASGFPDVSGHPFELAIRTVVAEGIVSGYPDGTLRPERTLTRAEFASMIVEAFDPDPDLRPTFEDVDGHWAEEKVRTVAGAGFFSGYPDGTFRPDEPVTKTEVIAALANGLGYAGGDPDDLEEAYRDGGDVPNWALVPLAAAHAAWDGIANYPDPAVLDPRADATRAEAAKYVYEASRGAAGSGPVPSATSDPDGSHRETLFGTLSRGESQVHDYALRTADPASVSIDLSGPEDADLDLYVTLDGREPTTDDFDRAARSYGSDETLTVDGHALADGAELGILVAAYDGGGEYELRIAESTGRPPRES